MKKQALGRGLSALIDTEIKTDGGSSINEIELSKIFANPTQPRTYFDEEALQELANSIREIGIVSPITLRKKEDETYQIIAGERRFRAAKLAGLDKIPAYIKTAEDEQVQFMALIENIQREDLNAIEIALSYYKLMEEHQLTQEGLSERVGKKRATIANYVRLLKLPAEIQMAIKDKRIDMGHARALAGMESPTEQLAIYESILASRLSVRATEELVKKASEEQLDTQKSSRTQTSTVNLTSLSEQVTAILKCKTVISQNDKGSGKMVITFKNEEDMKHIIDLIVSSEN